MMAILCQIGIGLFGMTAMFLVSTKGKWHRWGYVVGLVAQPFWYYTTWTNGQWGIFFLSFFYTFSWINGVRNRFGAQRMLHIDLSNVDWLTLRDQKLTLLQVINDDTNCHDVNHDLDGLVGLLDYIQDEAAETLGEESVFGEMIEL